MSLSDLDKNQLLKLFLDKCESEEANFSAHRNILLNFLGALIFGSSLIAFQPEVIPSYVFKKFVILIYFSSVMFLMVSKYLLADICRERVGKARDNFKTISDILLGSSNKFDNLSKKDPDERIPVIFAFLSGGFYIFGTLVGFYAILECSLQFWMSVIVSSFCFSLCVYKEGKRW